MTQLEADRIKALRQYDAYDNDPLQNFSRPELPSLDSLRSYKARLTPVPG
ncbi:hypothetical protein [Gallaecimonas xiamenensis]|nr:hypothetical protein [Gallaecimonas xiamenensis]